MDCSHNAVGDNNCGHSEDAGVVCEGAYDPASVVETFENNNFRLVLDSEVNYNDDGSVSGASGRLEYYWDGVWGTVCDDYFDSNSNAAQVACKTLGLPWTEAF